MITREDLDRAERCTTLPGCPVHNVNGIHDPMIGVDVVTELREWADVAEALEQAMPESWDADSTMGEIAGRWIRHMAGTHGAHCAGPHCVATAETPAHVAAIQRMWRDTAQYGTHPLHPATRGYRDAIGDLAHELGVRLDD